MPGSQLQRPHNSTGWVGEDSRACYTHANGTCVVVADESDCGLVREAHDGRLHLKVLLWNHNLLKKWKTMLTCSHHLRKLLPLSA